MKLSGWIFFDNTRKNFKLNLVLVLVLALKSKALYCKHISIKFKCKLPRLLRKHSPMFIAEVFNVLLLNLSRKRQTAIRQPFVANLTPDFSINHFPARTYLQVFSFPLWSFCHFEKCIFLTCRHFLLPVSVGSCKMLSSWGSM